MKRAFPPSGWAIRLSLAGAAALGAIAPGIAPAWADRPLQLSFKEAPGFARITAKWGDGDETAPKIAATVEGDDRVLILRFDQKVTVNLDALRQGLPSWASATRMDRGRQDRAHRPQAAFASPYLDLGRPLGRRPPAQGW